MCSIPENIKTNNLSVNFTSDNNEVYVEIQSMVDRRELAFWGDTIFANNIARLAKKFDDFGVVVNGARVLLEGV